MKKDRKPFSLFRAVSLLSQLLLVMGYLLAYASKGMPSIEAVTVVHAAFIMNFIISMTVLGSEYQEKSRGCFLAMAKTVFINYGMLFFFFIIWDGFPKW